MARPKEFDRTRVLDKAMRLFWARGYEAVSIQDLVEAMGINRQSLYDTFGDKQALFGEALAYYISSEGSKVEEVLAQAGSAKAAIAQAFQLVLEKPADELTWGCLIVNSSVEKPCISPEVSGVILDNLEHSDELFYYTLVRAQQQGELPAEKDLRALARFLANSFSGLRVTSKSIKDHKVLQDIVDVTLSVLN